MLIYLQIVLLMTKSVGDWFVSGGIADQMIKFNGFPYLHEKEEDEVHENVPGAQLRYLIEWKFTFAAVSMVMRKELVTLQSRGLTAKDLEKLLDEATVQGFPVVSTDENRTLLGYIERQELRYVLEKAQRTQNVQAETECSFAPENPGEERLRRRRSPSRLSIHGYPPPVAPGAALGFEEGEVVELIEASAQHDASMLHLWPWVNQVSQ